MRPRIFILLILVLLVVVVAAGAVFLISTGGGPLADLLGTSDSQPGWKAADQRRQRSQRPALEHGRPGGVAGGPLRP